MDVEWLRTFVIAAEEENFHRTAERLHLAQPTVTMQIQKLEQEWGVRLFERRGRQVHLSAAGHRLLRRVRALLAAYEESLEDLARWQQGYDDRVTLAVSPLVATTYLPLWIREFSRVHPEVELAVQVRESSEIVPRLFEHESDVALSRLQVAHPQIECVPLYEDPIVFVVPPDEYDIDGPAAAPNDWLRDYTVLTHSHPEYWDDLLLALRRLYPAIRTMRVSQTHVAMHFVGERMGVSFLPESSVRREVLRGRLQEVPFPAFELPVAHTYLLTRRPMRPVVQEFVAVIEDYMKMRPIR